LLEIWNHQLSRDLEVGLGCTRFVEFASFELKKGIFEVIVVLWKNCVFSFCRRFFP